VSTKKEILGIDCSRYPTNDYVTGVELYTKKVIDGILQAKLPYEIRLYTREKLPIKYPQTIIKLKKYWTFLGLGRELKRNPVDRLFVPSYALPSHAPAKSFVTVHGLEASYFPKAYSLRQKFLQKQGVRKAIKKCDRIIAVSRSVATDLQKIYKCPPEKIVVVHHGYEPEKITKTENLYGQYILQVGRLETRKNQSNLIRGFEKISPKFPKCKLVLAGGDGYDAKKIKKIIARSPVRDKIILLGAVPHHEALALMQNAAILAYPSLAEGFGLPILEAFGAGVPVLCSDTTCLPEIAGQGAFFVDPFSVKSIAKGLATLLGNESICQKIIADGKAQLQNFSWEKCVQETINILVS